MLAVTPANPLSLGQERLWFLHELNPDDASYNICVTERLVGDLDVAALERALNTVVRRHEVLRTRYPAVDGEPVAVVENRTVPLERVEAELGELTNRPFDLAGGPVIRAYLTADQTLVIVLHHIAGDGWSLGLLYDEIATLYSGGDLPDLPMQYGDHAREQRGQPVDTSFWRDRLDRVPVLDLPADLPRPRTRTSNGAVVTRRLPKELTDRVDALSRKERVTLFMLLMAAFQTQLHRYTGAVDFAVGTPVAARPDEDTEKLIGFFLNTVVLRADLEEDPTFRELLRRTRRAAIDAFTHADTPFDRVVQDLGVARDLSRTPVFQTQFSMRSEAGTRFHLAGLVAEPVDPDFHQAKFDLSLEITPTKDGLDAFFVYSADLFNHETIERFAANFETLLRSIVDDPGQRISRLDLVSPGETALLATWSGAPDEPVTPAQETLAEVISTRSPERVAIRHGDDAISYGKLHRRVAGTARGLREQGVGPGVRVAVCMDQSIDLAIALLAVLKAGGAYVPIDPEYPEERRAFMLADSGAAVLLTEIDDAEADDLEPLGTGDDLAYVIYTSGSTGRPKGVAVQNREILRYLADAGQRFDITDDAEYALLQSLAFDFGITILYLCLSTGGTLHLLPGRISGPELAEHMRGIDYVKLTPSHLGALAADTEDVADLLPRKLLIFGGEGSSWDFARDLARRVAVVNHYGPTEAIVGVSTYRVSPDVTPTGPITPIGKPLGHARLYVLDQHLRPAPAGVAGELCIGGRLAREYLGRPDLTAEKFVDHPAYGRLYRSGDLARWLPTGDLEFLGRRDLQVKIRGYRVELGEIDEALRVLPGVSHAVTDARDGELVGYLVADPRPTIGDLRRDLSERLPEYMVPTRWVFLGELPLKGHGKVDRASLPAPEDARPDQDVPFEPPADPFEEAIAAAWCEVLGLQRVGVLDDFFDLGGHSLLATRVVARLRKTLPEGSSPIALMDLFQHPTVRALAAVARSGDDGPRPLLYRLTRQGTKALVCLPYGGGSAVVYQPLADALPAEWELWSVAVPGHDLGLAEESQPLEVVAQRCVEEILRIQAPITLYGHCGVGGALTVEIARRLEAAGRPIDTVFLGGIFPFARPTKGVLGRWAKLARLERFRSDKGQLNWLTALGADLSDLDDAQKAFVIGNMRHDARAAEDYFTALMDSGAPKLRAPIVSVVGEYDPATDYYEERFLEWGFITEQTRLVVLDEAGHYFLKYRPDELAQIVTTPTGTASGASDPDLASRTDADPAEPPASGSAGSPQATLSKAALSKAGSSTTGLSKPAPSVTRFLLIAFGQMVCLAGSTLTEFALPLWVYLQHQSMIQLAILQVLAIIPGVLAAPLAGALVDRSSKRGVMIAGNAAALAVQTATGILVWTGNLHVWTLYILLPLLSVALTTQRLAFTAAVPQLVPKRYLGHANGIAQMALGMAQFVAPLAAVGLMSVWGLSGILVLDVVGHVFTIVVLALVAFPAALALRRRESVGREIAEGFKISFGNPYFRAMVIFFAFLSLGLSPVFMMYSPLVLEFGTIQDAGVIALAAGSGAVVGGLTMGLWGGPSRRRMRGMLFLTLIIAVSCGVVALRDDLTVIGVGAFGVSFGLALVNGVYNTIIQVKVPQRFHGRVFALNQMVAWSTIPIGVGIIAPVGTELLGDVSLMYAVFAGFILLVVVGALLTRRLARFDDAVPDATPDDLVGLERKVRNEGKTGRTGVGVV
ncbi:non-ribosomal peptide synthetase/MFS transporter [Herbidospora mongoliensis]|uniref:non-ribosomal peptide synthetase/MFS transporter n=1 Tax=Herbidospora mongoliensis TaxID=688067 RepID=UPI000834A17B|nr:non-ribosomal peptide synthetase/MFS transporter [Herbidospora mongoliensis]